MSDVNWLAVKDQRRYLLSVSSSEETERLKRSAILWVDTKEPSPTPSPLKWVIPLVVVLVVLVVLNLVFQVVCACVDYQKKRKQKKKEKRRRRFDLSQRYFSEVPCPPKIEPVSEVPCPPKIEPQACTCSTCVAHTHN